MSWWQEETAGLYNWAWIVIAVAIVVVIVVIITIAAVSHSRRKKRKAAEAQDEAVKVFEEEQEAEEEFEEEAAPEIAAKEAEEEEVVVKNKQFEAELHEPHIQFDVKLSDGLDVTFVVCRLEDDWAVAAEGSKRVLKLFDDADGALSFAKRLAAIYRGCAVFVGEDGKRTRYKFVGNY